MNENFENNVNEYTSDVVSGVEAAPKKKTGAKIAAIAVGAVVLVGGGSVIAYNCSDYVKNQVKLATLEPQEYYAWVTEESASEFSKSFSDSYEKYIDALEKGQSADVSLKYEATDDVKELIIDDIFGEASGEEEAQDFVDMINSINTIEIGSSAQTKKSAGNGSVYASVNDEKLLSAEYLMDNSALEYFFRIPELNEKWLGISEDEMTADEDLAEYSSEEALAGVSEALTGFLENPEDYLTAEEFETLVNRYVGVWTKSIKDVELEKKEEVDICDISVEYTVLTSEIDEKAAKEIAENFIKEASEDKLLKEIVTERFEICTEEDYDTALEEALAELESDTELDGEAVTLVTYVDPRGDIRGMALEASEDESFRCIMGLDDDKVRGELVFTDGEESFKAELNATEKSKEKYDGDISFEVVSQTYDYETDDYTDETTEFSVEFTGFEIVDEEKGYMNGEITIVIPEIDPIALTLESDGKTQDISFNLSIDGSDYGTFTLSMSQGKYDKSKVPAAEDAVMITDDFDIESYTNEEEVGTLITEILKKLGLDDENAALLGEEAASAMFSGYDNAVDEDIIWDDEDVDWDDEEIATDEWEDWEDEDWEADLTVESQEAFLCIADNSFMAYSYGDVYDTLELKGAKLNGSGTYTVSATTEGTDTVADGIYMLAICAYDAEAYENAVFTVDSIKVDGAEVALTGSECLVYAYDDELDVYIYDSWSEENIFDGASVGEWSAIEVTFTVSGF